MEPAAVIDCFEEGADALAGVLERGVDFAVDLPNFGRYVYDPGQAIMYNSGLVAADPKRHIPVVEDAIALIDAWLDHGKTLFKIEQIAISESFRVHGVAVTPMNACFLHYCRRSLKRYMHWRLKRLAPRQPEFRAGPPRMMIKTGIIASRSPPSPRRNERRARRGRASDAACGSARFPCASV